MKRNPFIFLLVVLGLLFPLNLVSVAADQDEFLDFDAALGAIFYLPFEDTAEPFKNYGLVGTGATPNASLLPEISSLGVKGNCFDNSQQIPEVQQEIISYQDEALQAAIQEVTSFTITFWMQTDKFYQHARPLHIPGLIDVNHSGSTRIGVLFEDSKQWCTSDAGPMGHNYQAKQWCFVAIVYDGTKTSNNFHLYYGSQDKPVTLDISHSASFGVLTVSNPELILGNIKGGHRPFPGMLDEVRMWVGQSSEGALDRERLEEIRLFDLGNMNSL